MPGQHGGHAGEGNEVRLTERGSAVLTRMDTDAGGAGTRMNTDYKEKFLIRVHPWKSVFIRVSEPLFR